MARTPLGIVSLPVRNKKEAQATVRRWKKETKISMNNAGYRAYRNIQVRKR